MNSLEPPIVAYLCGAMALAELVNRYAAHPRLEELRGRISLPQPQQIHLGGLQGSAACFVLAAAYQHEDFSKWNHVVVLDSPESAAYFHNAMESLTGALDLFYFPSSYKSPRDFIRLSSSHVMLRTEALMRFSKGGNRKILITYAQALLEKVESASRYADHLITIKTGDTLDVPGLLQQLDKHRFQRTDFVYEPGQFAIRGGILDIYSFGNDKPYRIELFGSEVDSIRIVDPETQLSERKILQVNIIPHVEALSSDSEQISLFDFLPANTIFWLEDEATSMEQARDWLLDLDAYLEKAIPLGPVEDEERGLVRLPSKNDLLSIDSVENGLIGFHRLSFGHQSNNSESTCDFQTRMQPAFNRQFELLIRDLKAHAAQGYAITIASENPRQLERLQQIFDDLQAELVFEPMIASIH
ncbi:MAG: hypothetical protein RLZZ256_657, partial [Bacteroidota bacterium]